MKMRITLGIMFLISVFMLQAQESQLVLTNIETHIERVIEPGKKIRVLNNQHDLKKGKLVVIDSSFIAVGNDTIPLSEITRVDAKTVDSRAIGAARIVLGTGVIALGIGIFEYSGYSIDDPANGGIAVLFILGGVVVSGGIKKLIVGQGYKRKKWVYSIRNATDTY